MATGFLWHEHYMWHDTGNYFGPLGRNAEVQPIPHIEHPEGKRRIKNLMDRVGLTPKLTPVMPRPATEAEILRFHTPRHLAHVQELSGTGGELGQRFAATPMAAGGYEITVLSAGGGIAMVDAVLDGTVNNGYALIRPPGHHAEPDEAMGFCIFGNVGIAALHALEGRGLKRVAIVDWDAHHGNGTQKRFWNDPRALTISIHQDRCFPPDSGGVDELGGDGGRGYNINIPLPPGSGEGAYLAAFERIIVPAVHNFQPELIIVASGFDAGAHDPLARMLLHSGSYRTFTRLVKQLAAECCGGKLAVIHEGGYAPHMTPFLCLAVVEELLGVPNPTPDPYQPGLASSPWQALLPHQEQAVVAAEQAIRSCRAVL
jgi:acetoin utilization deacetylase AcuC-like enzyme